VLEAERILLVAGADDADAGHLSDLDPVFRDRRVVAEHRLGWLSLGVGVELI